ncbi:hypothetical protein DFH29DRAFT_878413 [Suillus ampliporus]|nr:hypothetical protein DFH29DRAFT_878413 [Suillus ampliporus]
MVNGAAHQARPTAGVTTTVPSQTQTQTCRKETPTVAGMPVVTLGVTNAVPSEVQAETPHKQMCMVADMQALVLPDVKNTNTQRLIHSAYGEDMYLIIGPPVYLRLSGIIFSATPALQLGYPSYLDTRNTYPELLDFKDLNYWNTYLARVQALLRCPYVQWFLTLGGILWCLALQFSPPSLLNDTLAGPSLDVTIWGIGDVINGQWDDSVMAADITMQIGISGAGSYWPPHDVWNASCQWKGF